MMHDALITIGSCCDNCNHAHASDKLLCACVCLGAVFDSGLDEWKTFLCKATSAAGQPLPAE